MLTKAHVCGVSRSILGQPWRWRGAAADDHDEAFRPDDLIDQLLMARGVGREALERHRLPTVRGFMPDPSLFRDMDKAAERLADSVEAGERVTVFGDYDVDGATSAALLVRLLRGLGSEPRAYIPDRLMEGYGPSGEALVRLAREGARLIVTVDCGAQAFEALAMAREAGLDVIVVDHHKCASALPSALALVNPNRLDEAAEASAHGHLAAVGVCFLLAAATLRVLRGRGFFAGREEPRLIELLDLVALGTVADVAQLRGLNRAFVTQGLKVMANRRNAGLAALIDAARLNRAPNCTDLGWALGPRINAGGRVGKSDLGVRLLTTDDPAEAEAIAAELDRLNEERRAIESVVCEAAESLCGGQDNRSVIVATGESWHPGVIGIVAGRLKERFGRPAIVVALGEDGLGKGSGRSIGGVDLGAAVMAAKDLGLLVAGGGHAMAAGLTVERGKIEALCEFLDERLAAGPVRVVKADVVGNGHLRLIVAGDDGRRIKAIAFRMAASPLGEAMLSALPHRKLWVAGRVKKDEWEGRVGAELHLEDAAWCD
jgi:single-stranded-DNA-specific exonuclease